MGEEFDDLLRADGLLEDLELEIPECQPGDDGQRLPVEMELEHGRLAAGRPGAAAVRPLAQPAFVEEDDRAALFLGFF